MINLFLITSKTKIDLKSKNMIISNKSDKKEIPVSKINNIFLFNKNRIPNAVLDKTKNISVYSINNHGHIRFLKYPKRKYKNFKNQENIARYILKINYYQIKAYIKNMPSYDREIYRENPLLEQVSQLIDLNIDKLKISDIHLILNRLHFSILYISQRVKRKYENNSPENITINLFHSLYISYLTTFLTKNGINPHQKVIEYKNGYPDVSRLIFNLLKIHSTILAIKTFDNLIIPRKDFLFGKIKETGILMIAKIFTENFIHNPKMQLKFNSFWEGMKKIEEGKLSVWEI